MNFRLDGKKALVTVSTAGIGSRLPARWRGKERRSSSWAHSGAVDNATESVRPEIRDTKINWVAADLATPE